MFRLLYLRPTSHPDLLFDPLRGNSFTPMLLLTLFSSTKSQKTHWDRLDALNKKRSSLELFILASMRSIEQHSANISNEMDAMFGGRIDDIQEGSASQSVTKDLVSLTRSETWKIY
jgi:succinylglutamate desuccinylase